MSTVFGIPVESFNAVFNAVTAVAACLAAVFAFRGLHTWKSETLGRRKAELAEDLISGFYEARDIIMFARSPGSYSSEWEGIKLGEHDDLPEETKELLLPLARIDRNRKPLADLHAKRYRARALFGGQIDEAFSALQTVEALMRTSFRIAFARAKHHPKNGNGLSADETYRKHEARLFWDGDNEDEIKKELDAAVARVERMCSPSLS
jgi:hypothetical protein